MALNGEARIEDVAQPTNVSGRQLGWLGGEASSYAIVDRPGQFAAGQYDLSVRYANADRNTGHAYNADVITRFLDITEDGGPATRGAFRHNYSWKGFWTHTVPLDLATSDGNLRLGNATSASPTSTGSSCSPLTLGVTNVAAEPQAVIVPAVTTRCVAGKVYLAVQVENVDEVPIAETVTTGFGGQVVPDDRTRQEGLCRAGHSPRRQIGLGTVSATLTAEIDGSDVSATGEATNSAANCG